MPFKLTPDGNIVTQEVNGQKLPVFVGADGKEAPFDGDSTLSTITRLNGEAHSHRERAERAEGSLKGFEGIADPAAALKALNIVKGLDEKKLVDAGARDQAIAEAVKSVKAEFEPFVTKAKDLEQQLYGEKIGGAFARSKFISEKIAVPADMVQATFGNRFKVVDGKTIALDANGQQIFSRVRHGEAADFEEALEIMVEAYPHRASILKGSGASGGGASGGGNQGAGGKKTVTRAQFEAMDPSAQAATARDSNVEIIA